MSDGGSRTLKFAYINDTTLDIASLGKRIGAWLKHLHHCSRLSPLCGKFDNKVGKTTYRYCYENLGNALENNGCDKMIGERINERYGSLLQTDNDCVCHGDFWPGNILISDHAEAENQVLMVVDWEMVRTGNGATDVGQFAAEAWLLDRFHGGKGLFDAFLNGYLNGGKLGHESAVKVAVQFGTHLGFWPTIVEWCSNEETKEVIAVGYGILKAVCDENWQGLRGSDLRRLFLE